MEEVISSWEEAYRNRPTAGYGEIREDSDLDPLLKVFGDDRDKRILDLGCGDGCHLVFLAKWGFTMYGLDYAPTALRLTREWLSKEDLDADLKCADMSSIPWQDGHFDAVIATMVIDHNSLEEIRATLGEVFRVLKPGGYFLATVMKYNPNGGPDKRKSIEIEPRTYVPLLGHDRGVPHHRFIEWELKELLHEFELVRLSGERRFLFLVRKPTSASASGNG